MVGGGVDKDESNKRQELEDDARRLEAPEEFSDELIQRVFRLFTVIALLMFILGGVILFSRLSEDGFPRNGATGFGVVAERLGVGLQRNVQFPRLSPASASRVEAFPQKDASSEPLEIDPDSRRFSGGLSLIRGANERVELLVLSHWPEGQLSRWRLTEQGVLEQVRFTQERGVKDSGWISIATVDINGDGMEDLITAGHGDIGCWLRGRLSGEFLWQADGCGLVIDGDAWVSAIEVLDANQDGKMDVWMSLMSRGPQGWSGKPNELWLYEGRRFRKAPKFLKSTPPSRASHASALIDVDLDGTLEVIVANLDGPPEVWRQLRRYPFVESREFFGFPERPIKGEIVEYQPASQRELLTSDGNTLERLTYPVSATGTSSRLTDARVNSTMANLHQVLKWDYDMDGSEELLLLGDCEDTVQSICYCRDLLGRSDESGQWLTNLSTPDFRNGEKMGIALVWDIDRDGDDDLIALGDRDVPKVFLNQSDFGHHWFGVKFSEAWRHGVFEVTRSDGRVFLGVLGVLAQGRTKTGFSRKFGLSDGFYVSKVRVFHPRLGERVWVEPQPLNFWLNVEE